MTMKRFKKISIKNKTISLLLSTVMVLATILSFPLNSFAEGQVWDNTADISWYNDTDTTFVISTAEQLAGFAQLVNEGNNFSGKTVRLINDITLNTTTIDENGNVVSGTFNSWTSIGSTQSNKFSGNFDGNNHTIYNLYSTNTGLFNYVANGSIKNIILANTYINSTQSNVGAFVGNCESEIENCHAKNINVIAINNVGGIAGMLSKNTTYCSVQGLITGNKYIGGIIGCARPLYYEYPNFYIDGCWFDGNIVSTESRWAYAGGIVGFSRTVLDSNSQYGNSAIVTNCFSHGIINSPPEYVGAIAGTIHPFSGFKTEIRNCYSDMVINTNNFNTSYTVASYICGEKKDSTYDCHYSVDALSQCSSNYNYDVSGIKAATAENISDGILASALYRKSENSTYVWGQKIGTNPAPIITTDKSLIINYCYVAFYSNGNLLDNVYLDSNNTVGTFPDPNTRLNQEFVKWVVKGTDTEFTADTIVMDDVEVDAVFNTTYPLTGEGTQDSPYLLASSEDYNKFATICNQGDTTYINAYYKVTEDLTFTENPVYCNTFNGVFDGNDKTLSFNKTLENSSSLFGTNNGTIKNLIINGYSLISSNTVGIACSKNNNTINNCRVVNSSISQELILAPSENIVGGIAGITSKDSVISNCVVADTKLSGYYCGGIAGETNTATVSHCTVESNTTFCFQKNYIGAKIGGITACSIDSTIEYCANYANLDYGMVAPEYSGGIVGYVQCMQVNSTINHCINYGKCEAYRNASGIVGEYFIGIGVYFYIQNSINCGIISGVEENVNITPELNHFTSTQNSLVNNRLVSTENLYYLSNLSTNGFENAQPVDEEDIVSGLFPYNLNQNAGADVYTSKDSKLYIADSINVATHKITVEGAIEATLYSDHTGKVIFPECQQEGSIFLFTSDGTPTGTKYTNDSVFTEDTTVQATLTFPTDENRNALIFHAYQLEIFAKTINGTDGFTANNALNAKLMNDIDMTEITWSPISTYFGTFDGNGKMITGLNNNLFKQLNGTVKNLIVKNSSSFPQVTGGNGMITGRNNGTIEKVIVDGCSLQYGAYDHFGGIAGWNQSSGVIRDCAVINTALTRRYSGSTTKPIGGIVDINQGTVENCYTYGCNFTNGTTKGGIVAQGTVPVNSYYFTSSKVDSTVDGTPVAETKIHSGEVAYLLNNGKTDGTQAWYQTAGSGAPHLNRTAAETIYKGYDSCVNTEPVYANTPLSETKPDHTYNWINNGDGTHTLSCSACGIVQETASHTFGDWIDRGDGTHTRSCSVCGAKETASHTFGDWIDRGDGTHIRICVCNAEEIAGHIVPVEGSGTHIDYSGKYISNITCGLKDVAEYITAIDGYSYALVKMMPYVGTGTMVVISDGENKIPYIIVVFGDVNGDGWYDGMDAMIVSCIANGMLTKDDVGEAVYMAADCNHDGVIDNYDVEILQQAGVLLAGVDQTKNEEELLETSSAYVEYLSLIDQSGYVDDTTDKTVVEPTEPSTPDVQRTFIEEILTLFMAIWKCIFSFMIV